MKKSITAATLFISLGIMMCNVKLAVASEKDPSAVNTSEIMKDSAVEADSYIIEHYPYIGDYDYEFYLKGIYLSANGKDDKLYIHPIDLVFGEETEKLREYGIKDEGVTYYVYEYTDETIALPLKQETQFHIINWNRNPELARLSLNHPDPELGCICALDDPLYFFRFMSDDYGEHLASYPLCLYLDEDGYVDTVIELSLP